MFANSLHYIGWQHTVKHIHVSSHTSEWYLPSARGNPRLLFVSHDITTGSGVHWVYPTNLFHASLLLPAPHFVPLEMHPHLHLITLGPNIMEGLVIPSENKVKVHLVAFTRPLKHITRSSPVVYADLFELTLN